MKKFYLSITLSIVALFIGMIIGIRFLAEDCDVDEEKKIVTSQTVLDKISDQSFLVTKSILINQETEKTSDQGWWDKLWFKDESQAKALVEVDLGIDLSKLDNEDINIDTDTKTITINIPEAEIDDITLEGDIELKTASGIITKFTRDKDEDYNEAIKMLKDESKNAVKDKLELFESARESAVDLLNIILSDLDYDVMLEKVESLEINE